MQKKLTLRLEKQLIDYAKRHAEEHGTSVSRVVANYFAALSAREVSTRETASSQKSAFQKSAFGNSPRADASQADASGEAERKTRGEDLPPLTRSLLGAFAKDGEQPSAFGEDGSDLSKSKLRAAYYDRLETKHR